MSMNNNLNTAHASMTHNEKDEENLSRSNPMMEQNSNSKQKAEAPKSTLQPKLHERLVHILAIDPFTKDDLYERLTKDGLSDCDKSEINNCLKDIAIFEDDVYSLRDCIWNDVDEDWPYYTEEEREEVRLNKIYKAASMLLDTKEYSSTGSDSADIGISLSRDFEEPQLQTVKMQRVNALEKNKIIEATQIATHERDKTKTAVDQILADILSSAANEEQKQEQAGQSILYQQTSFGNNQHRPLEIRRPQKSDTEAISSLKRYLCDPSTYVSKKQRIIESISSALQPEGCYIECTGKNSASNSIQEINNSLWSGNEAPKLPYAQLPKENANVVLKSKDKVGVQATNYVDNKTTAPLPHSVNFNQKQLIEQIHLQPHTHLIDTTDLSKFPETT
ncbi:uncharacterized protein LOC101455885 isoform X2 [Ceratitis capitata]|uniref:uncharacterized protein LOC101455885 isoform X2 n=1 Tax=Ceratitis capitata TaxID=7213 RepID=UPI000329C75B|nr:uncharacterized protein LOC101455885 isoform X2 [Ceratitis capitata]